MSFQTLKAEAQGPVLHLTLHRPEVRNAMSLAMVLELRQALEQAEHDGRTRVVVLRGAGGHFCAGGDIADMVTARQRLPEQPDAIAELNRAFGELCVAYAGTGLAVVAVVQGTVMGGGFGLACVADVTLADETAVFRLPETGLGLVPAQVAPFLVERLGSAEARRLAVTGAAVDAAEALRLRLVHQVHIDTEALDWALQRLLADILRCAPGALAATKRLVAQARLHSAASLVQAAADSFAAALMSPEGQEGTMAFLQKRKPSWVPAP